MRVSDTNLTQQLANMVNFMIQISFRQIPYHRLSQREMATEIVVSVIGGGFAVVVALISKIGRENKKDHGEVHRTLGRIEQKIDGHLEDHK